MNEKKKEYFTSRWGFVLSLIGVAIGAGNIWRFSRVVAQNGGGSFLIPWIVFLFVWSIPLIIAELAIGKLTRKAPIGAMIQTGGKSFAWMGAFIACVATGILFYYSVVVGWGFSYFFFGLFGEFEKTSTLQIWNHYSHSLQPLFAHFFSILIGCFIIYKGIVHGVEKSNKFLMPALFFMIILICIRAITLPGASDGLRYLFTPYWADLMKPKIWLEALTQNAWDTGAGWGLLLVYAGYAKKEESITVNGSLTALFNNVISLIMGITIFSTIFALEHQTGVKSLIEGDGSTNTGLTFIYLPQLFQEIPGGPFVHRLFSSLFFLAFSFAALSSMISMVQLTSQTFEELGLRRNKAILLTGFLGFLFGTPSALSSTFFDNQDWVWSVGLILSGLFISIGVMRYGATKLRKTVINSSPDDFKLGPFYTFVICFLIPLQALILLGWLLYQGIYAHVEWWNPFLFNTTGTLLFQWGIALICFFALNRWFVKKYKQNSF